MGKSSKKDSFISQSENPTPIEKAGLKVVNNYECLVSNYQSALSGMIAAAREVDTVLYQYSGALNKFSKSMKTVMRACKDTPGSDENIDSALKEFESLHDSIGNEYNDFSQFYASDLIKPFEEKLQQDTSYLEDQLRTFKNKFGENFRVLQEKEDKLDKLNKNRGKNKKDDKKRMELETEISQRRQALETYTKDKLKKSVSEQRQRYVFLTKKHASHVKKLKLLYEQCGRHVEDCQDNLDTNFDATVPSERASEMEKLFPEPRQSVYNKEHSPDRLASPQANSIYTLTQSDASDDFIPPKPSGRAPGKKKFDTVTSIDSLASLGQLPRVDGRELSKAVKKRRESMYKGPPPTSTKNKKLVKATHGFQGGDATQLKIEPGDYIQLLIPQPRDGWHYGENDRTGLKGWFPIKYTIKV